MKGYVVALALCVTSLLGADGVKRGSEGQSREMVVPGAPSRGYEEVEGGSYGGSQAQLFDGVMNIRTPSRSFMVQFRRGSPMPIRDKEAFVNALKRVQPGQKVVFSTENGATIAFTKNEFGQWTPSFENEGGSERISATDVLIAIACFLLLTATW